MTSLNFYKSVEAFLEDKSHPSSVLLSSLPSPLNSTVALSLVNTLWLWGTQVDPKDTEKWNSLCKIVREISVLQIPNDKSSSDNNSQPYYDMISLMKQCLEINLLVGADILNNRDRHTPLNPISLTEVESQSESVRKRLIRTNTSLIYKQHKYNLLREETEGYSKLVVILCKMPLVGGEQYVGNVLSLVGHFDLDPNRVLDIALDAFEQQPHNKSFFLLLNRFPSVNITHILGFKLSCYEKRAPSSLFVLSAILLLRGFVNLEDLLLYTLPTLSQTAKEVITSEESLSKEISQFGMISIKSTSSTSSSLLNDGPIPISAVTTSSEVSRTTSSFSSNLNPPPPPATSVKGNPPPPAGPPPGSKDKFKKPVVVAAPVVPEAVDEIPFSLQPSSSSSSEQFAGGNQLVGLICGLLQVGGWRQARLLLNRLEEEGMDSLAAMRVFPDLRQSLVSLCLHLTDPVYAPFRINLSSSSSTSSSSSDEGLLAHVMRDCFPPEELVPPVERLDELLPRLSPLLSFLGYHVSSSPSLLTRLCRLTKSFIETGGSSVDLDQVISLFSTCLLPALSVHKVTNPFLASQVALPLLLLPFPVRFSIYDNWRGSGLAKDGMGSKPAEVTLAESRALQTARADLKRLAKENTKVIGRKLSKVTQSCPLVVYNHVLNQVESFDNLIPCVVEALKYSNDLARDCMAYCLVSQLKSKQSNMKLKDGDTNYSQWFIALAKFIATFYGRYPTTELKGLLHYLLRSFSDGDCLDLLVLKELLGVMGGCETLLDVSAIQLEGLSAGRALRAEVMGISGGGSAGAAAAGLGIKQVGVGNKKASSELRSVLMNSKTAMPLLLFIAQIRSKILNDPEIRQLKLISHLFDMSQDVLMQFTDFLVTAGIMTSAESSNNKILETISSLMPSLPTMIKDIGLAVSVAFQLVRPIMREALKISMDPTSPTIPEHLRKWHPFGEDLLSFVSSYTGDVLPAKLYILFWSLSLYDINAPASRYDMEIKRLRTRYLELETKPLPTTSALGISLTKSESEKLSRQRKSEINKLMVVIAELNSEKVSQQNHVDSIREYISSSKVLYFPTGRDCTMDLMQSLVYHRALMSPIDAVFCIQFFQMLHNIDTPFFSVVRFHDRMINTIAPLLFSTTEREAAFIGYALNDQFIILNRWATSAELYCQEVKKQSPDTASYESFLETYEGWHTKLTDIIIACIDAEEYMFIRSGLIFLSKVSQNFPTRYMDGKTLLKRIEKLKEDETERVDLQTMALSLSTILKRNMNNWTGERPVEVPVEKPSREKEKESKDIGNKEVDREKQDQSKGRDRDRHSSVETTADIPKMEKEKEKEKESTKAKDSKESDKEAKDNNNHHNNNQRDKEPKEKRDSKESDKEAKDKDRERDKEPKEKKNKDKDKDKDREKDKEKKESKRDKEKKDKDKDKDKDRSSADAPRDRRMSFEDSNRIASSNSLTSMLTGNGGKRKLTETEDGLTEHGGEDKRMTKIPGIAAIEKSANKVDNKVEEKKDIIKKEKSLLSKTGPEPVTTGVAANKRLKKEDVNQDNNHNKKNPFENPFPTQQTDNIPPSGSGPAAVTTTRRIIPPSHNTPAPFHNNNNNRDYQNNNNNNNNGSNYQNNNNNTYPQRQQQYNNNNNFGNNNRPNYDNSYNNHPKRKYNN